MGFYQQLQAETESERQALVNADMIQRTFNRGRRVHRGRNRPPGMDPERHRRVWI